MMKLACAFRPNCSNETVYVLPLLFPAESQEFPNGVIELRGAAG